MLPPMRLGIDLDGVVADFNGGWMRLHANEFGSDLDPSMVTSWDGLHEVGGFTSMRAFWRWAKGSDERPSIFRHFETYPGAVDTLQALAGAGHHIVVVTTKPDWAVTDTLRWLADHEIPTREIHITKDKRSVVCDVYLDDAPPVLVDLVANRPDALVCRFVRPWNEPVAGAVDVADWWEFHGLVARRSGGTTP